MTVKELYTCCKVAILNGEGDKTILLSDDEEGNGFHEMFYAFTSLNNYFELGKDEELTSDKLSLLGFPDNVSNNTHIILG